MNNPGLPLPDGEPGPGAPTRLILSAQQRAFHEMLKKLRDGRLADWYLGAIMVQDQVSNPDRISLAILL